MNNSNNNDNVSGRNEVGKGWADELKRLVEYPGRLVRWRRGHWRKSKAEEMMYKPPISLVLDKSSKPSPIQESGCGRAAAALPRAVGG